MLQRYFLLLHFGYESSQQNLLLWQLDDDVTHLITAAAAAAAAAAASLQHIAIAETKPSNHTRILPLSHPPVLQLRRLPSHERSFTPGAALQPQTLNP